MTGSHGAPAQRVTASHKARKHALDILFEADLRATDAIATLEERKITDVTVRDLTETIVRGVCAHRGDVDAQLVPCLADGWTLDRMPRVDRVIARIATYELLFTDTASNVVVSEAVKLASDLSTDDSPAFLNAVLAKVSRTAA